MIHFEAPKRVVNRIFIHCSASDALVSGLELITLIRKWHLERGFSDIGYHYIIDKMGGVWYGRDSEKTPAAQQGHNTGTIAICVHGLDFGENWYKSLQARALRMFCTQINNAYSGVIAFWPHNAVSNKACPVFDIQTLLQLDKWRRMP